MCHVLLDIRPWEVRDNRLRHAGARPASLRRPLRRKQHALQPLRGGVGPAGLRHHHANEWPASEKKDEPTLCQSLNLFEGRSGGGEVVSNQLCPNGRRPRGVNLVARWSTHPEARQLELGLKAGLNTKNNVKLC